MHKSIFIGNWCTYAPDNTIAIKDKYVDAMKELFWLTEFQHVCFHRSRRWCMSYHASTSKGRLTNTKGNSPGSKKTADSKRKDLHGAFSIQNKKAKLESNVGRCVRISYCFGSRGTPVITGCLRQEKQRQPMKCPLAAHVVSSMTYARTSLWMTRTAETTEKSWSTLFRLLGLTTIRFIFLILACYVRSILYWDKKFISRNYNSFFQMDF